MKIDEAARLLKLSRRAALAALKKAGIVGKRLDRTGRPGPAPLDYDADAVEALRLERLAKAEARVASLKEAP